MRDMNTPKAMQRADAPVAPIKATIKAAEVLPALDLIDQNGGAIAVLSGTDGGFYRPMGAVMAIDPQGRIQGQISAGCVDDDIATHAKEVMDSGQTKRLRYGEGSPFWDIRLPCGSGIDVDIFPADAIKSLRQNVQALKTRQQVSIEISTVCSLDVLPDTQIIIFGKGHEIEAFVALAEAAKMPLSIGDVFQPDLAGVDEATAVVFFFHDHAVETALLCDVLKTPAFWIGAQGSHNSQTRRKEALAAQGVSEKDLARVLGPIGLIPKARNPQDLAISVLAEITAAR